MEPLITTELENAIHRLRDVLDRRQAVDSVVARERELNEQAARRVLNVLHDVSREFTLIDLGMVEDDLRT